MLAPHDVGTDDESFGKVLPENMTVYSRYLSGTNLPVKYRYHEFFASICFCVVASVPNSNRLGKDMLGH